MYSIANIRQFVSDNPLLFPQDEADVIVEEAKRYCIDNFEGIDLDADGIVSGGLPETIFKRDVAELFHATMACNPVHIGIMKNIMMRRQNQSRSGQ
jgi:hypothetical protein